MKRIFLSGMLCIFISASMFAQNGKLSKEGYEQFVKAGKLIEEAGTIKDINQQATKFIEAINVLEQITKSDPEVSDIYFNLSVLYKNIGLSTLNPEYIKKSANNLEKYKELIPSEDKRAITQKVEIELAAEKVWAEVEKDIIRVKIRYKDNGKVDLGSFMAFTSLPEIKIIEKHAKREMRPWAIPAYIFGMPGAAAVGAGIPMYFTKDYESGEYELRDLSKKLLLYGGCSVVIGGFLNSIGVAKYKKVVNREVPLYNNSIDSRLEDFKKSKPNLSLGVTNSGGLGLTLNF